VPLGKLHSERWVPVDDETRRLVAQLVQLRALAPSSCLAKSQGFLLPRCTSRSALYRKLLQVLDAHARRAHCTGKVTPHRLRHYATSRTMPPQVDSSCYYKGSGTQSEA
jgi:integrase